MQHCNISHVTVLYGKNSKRFALEGAMELSERVDCMYKVP